MPTPRRVAFVTIGQSPRTDVVPAILAHVGPGVEAVEVGVLDGLGRDAIARLAPAAGEHTLVSRLVDGAEVTLGKPAVQRRLQAIMDDLDARGFFLIVLLCTGTFPGLRSRTLLVEAQRVVDHTVAALSEDRTVGVMVPLPQQVDEVHVAGDHRSLVFAHASPYSDQRFEEAARELGKVDLIVMHCIGYSEAMRQRVAAVVDTPILLARRLVAGAVAQLAS